MPVKALTHRQRRGRPTDCRPNAQARGYDAAWNRTRLAFITENPICFVEGCGQAASVVDHKVPISVNPGRRLDWSNLRSCCRHHHDLITARLRREGVNELPPEHA